MNVAGIPVEIDDPLNAAILAVSEDRVEGFHRDPLGKIAALSGVPVSTVIERLSAMLRAGVIRRIRQTLLATNLAQGALVAWQIPPEQLNLAFEYMFREDPFSGHVVLRSTDGETAGSKYKLWTTLKVPQGFDLAKHCDFLMAQVGAVSYKIMPARRLFVLGVGHVRRKGVVPGSMTDEPAQVLDTEIVNLTDLQWKILVALKREFAPEELSVDLWQPRARQAGVDLPTFCEVAEELVRQGVIGRFSTFLEHVKPLATGERVTQYNALFHWAAPVGREIETGQQVGRFHIMTHAYWREGGPDFGNVNIMGVAHGQDKSRLLEHKAAIDRHLAAVGIPIAYSNVFWGGRSEIKPSEIAPQAYRDWCARVGLDSRAMRERV
ncbi:MAG: Lrp/AsnC family transcriptional regulator [Phycisphaerae bacterium]|nr:Lrp/AsnC family transcriptional regulator [Phycisphaerae bacterium]